MDPRKRCLHRRPIHIRRHSHMHRPVLRAFWSHVLLAHKPCPWDPTPCTPCPVRNRRVRYTMDDKSMDWLVHFSRSYRSSNLPLRCTDDHLQSCSPPKDHRANIHRCRIPANPSTMLRPHRCPPHRNHRSLDTPTHRLNPGNNSHFYSPRSLCRVFHCWHHQPHYWVPKRRFLLLDTGDKYN